MPHLVRYISVAEKTIKLFFGSPFPKRFVVWVHPSRSTLNPFWQKELAVPPEKIQCWMVGSGNAEGLVLLSPNSWQKEACDHDSTDEIAIQRLITHELVHSFQANALPKKSFDGLDPLEWFVEGLAVYVSGQLQKPSSLPDSAETLKQHLPSSLVKAHRGRYRYGFSGSLVQYLDVTYGRQILLSLVPVSNIKTFFSKLAVSEGEFLEDWQRYLKLQTARRPNRE